ncbi:MAG TPA: outer membrane beta-barrel protein [Verrucomicrobiae bacterium]|nr:outer membrane beta-barrel protein [Verrucomicrobiae bacterium]
MKVIKNLSAIAVLGLLLAAKTQAQYAPTHPYQYQYQPYPSGPFYLGVDVGGAFVQSMKLKNLGSGADLDPGVRADFTFGYEFAPPIAVEFETGTLWNRFSDNSPFGQAGIRADLYQVPFLANFVGHFPVNNTGLSFYAGVGAGGVASELDLSQENFGFRAHANDTDFTFAYQAKAGVNYEFAPNMAVGLGYKFLGTLDHRWFEGDPNLYIHSGPSYSHAILASFTWRF